jgi:hypothetical protein
VFLLSGIVTIGTIGMAQAVTPVNFAPTVTEGGCTATIDGADIGTFNRNHPLVVREGQRVIVKGFAPQQIRNRPEPPGAVTSVYLDFTLIKPIKHSGQPKTTNGYQTFQSLTNVDDYLKLGSGLYRVGVVAAGLADGNSAWKCSATFYVQLDGNTAAAFLGGLAAATGIAVAASSAGKSDWGQGDVPPEGEVVDPNTPDLTEGTGSKPVDVQPDKSANRRANGESALGCLFAFFLFLIGDEGFLFGDDGGPIGAALLLRQPSNGRRFWRRGHPVRGCLGGLLAGLGLTVLLQQRAYVIFTWQNTIAFPLLTALIGGWRGWRGRAFVITAPPSEVAEAAE